MVKLIEEETLDRMFNDDVGKGHLKKSGRWHWWGADVAIIIERTNRGYGFQGGVVYELNNGQIHIQCERCFKKIGK